MNIIIIYIATEKLAMLTWTDRVIAVPIVIIIIIIIRTFSHFGPHIWNNLPQDIRHSATLSSFKSQLKTFLFSEYFS